jgi:hypothetical protein
MMTRGRLMTYQDLLSVLEYLTNETSASSDVPRLAGKSREEILDVIDELLGRGWVDGTPLRGDDRLLSIRQLRITNVGQAAMTDLRRRASAHAGRRPSGLVGLQLKKTQRAQFMKDLYETAGASSLVDVDPDEIAARLSIDRAELGALTEYLEGERLLQWSTLGHVTITHLGVVEVEQFLEEPNRATEHFPPSSSVVIYGNASNVQILAGSPGASQTMGLGQGELMALIVFAKELRRILDEAVNVTDIVREEMEADLRVLEAQLESPAPKRGIIKEAVRSLRAIGENLVANGIWLGGIEIINQLPF